MEMIRSLLVFLLLVGIIRLLGKRQVGQMEPAEFVVALLIANLAAIPVENPERSVWDGLGPMLLIFAAERLLSLFSFRSIRLRRLLCGKPVILIENGRPIPENLRRTRVNLDELSGQIRQMGVLSPDRVQFAILETNGTLSVFPFPQHQPASARDAGIAVHPLELPYTVISDGHLLEENLAAAGKSRLWLRDYLSGQRCSQREVLLLTVTRNGKPCLLRKS